MTQKKWPWFERKFDFSFPPEKMPELISRLEGAVVRIGLVLEPVELTNLEEVPDEGWSIKQNIGHLADLEPLWLGRVEDILSGQATMRAADLTNQATKDADHNSEAIETLQTRFANLRSSLLTSLEALGPEQWELAAQHPRLLTPMRMVDLCFFVAEHDDYHIARMSYLAKVLASSSAAHER